MLSMKNRKPLLIVLLALTSALALGTARLSGGDAGTVDLGFDPGDALGTDFGVQVHSVLVQPDGRVLVGGGFSISNGAKRDGIMRLDFNGKLDAGFTPRVTQQGGFWQVNALALQGAKILVGGRFDSVNGFSRNGLARLNADGTLDASFNPKLGPFPEISVVLVQPDKKILIGGTFSIFDGNRFFSGFARLASDGSPDATFDTSAWHGSFVQSAALQSDGKVLVGGWFPSGSDAATNLVRLNKDGSLDAGYSPTFNLFGTVLGISLQSDGKAVILGEFNNVSGLTRYGCARLNHDGSVDKGFEIRDAGADRFSLGGRLQSVAIQADQKILLGGMFSGTGTGWRSCLARFRADGTPDPSFTLAEAQSGDLGALAVQADGKILIGGGFASYDGLPRRGIVRLNGSATVPVAPRLDFRKLTATGALLQLRTEVGVGYVVEHSSDLVSWQELTTFVSSSDPIELTDDTAPQCPARFYRARVVP